MINAIKIYAIPCLLNAITILILEEKIMNKKYKIWRRLLFVIFLFIFLIYNNFVLNYAFKTFATLFIILFLSKFYFNEKIENLIIPNFFVNLILFISEFIFSIIIIIKYGKMDFLLLDKKWIIISNFFICLLSIIIINFKLIYNNIKKIVFCFYNRSKSIKYNIMIYGTFLINFLLLFSYINNDNRIYLIFNVCISILYIYLFYSMLNEKSKNFIYLKENKMLMTNLNEYEKMLNSQRILNHENQNQLLIIKELIKNKDLSVIDYVQEIINEKLEDDIFLSKLTENINSSGLRGLIYQKMLKMKKYDIKVELNVFENIFNLDNLSSGMKYDIYRIVGIILDNSIEATKNSKNKEILIEIYVDENYYIEVSNYFEDDLNINNFYKEGYSTKIKGHGYGLSLLKKILRKNQMMENKVYIINNIIKQQIIINKCVFKKSI